MAEKFNLQERFLNLLRTNKIECKIYFEGGFQTSGYIKSFDNFTILLEKKGQQSLVYKHAVKMIVPMKYVKLFQQQYQENQSGGNEN
ncbi:RNA chaperone Hfq [Marinitoga sp. 1138]|uniref:RNA chaperone Hfq n=1 Tax=Marinitoga sp. 1138 TaxID=1643334 RepID=UPI001586211E|nr:RNA chaperone Hfq [Marinitoga sp. 1138]NUU97644.1 RNA-binding protein Hfq [Marinitoga sp. 1138]